MKTLHAVLICPFTHTVSDVIYAGTLQGHAGAYQLLGCDIVEATYAGDPLNDHAHLYCDEEGRLKPQDGARGFIIPGQAFTIVGRGLLVGAPDMQGGETACPYDARTVAAVVQWVDDILDYEPVLTMTVL